MTSELTLLNVSYAVLASLLLLFLWPAEGQQRSPLIFSRIPGNIKGSALGLFVKTYNDRVDSPDDCQTWCTGMQRMGKQHLLGFREALHLHNIPRKLFICVPQGDE